MRTVRLAMPAKNILAISSNGKLSSFTDSFDQTQSSMNVNIIGWLPYSETYKEASRQNNQLAFSFNKIYAM